MLRPLVSTLKLDLKISFCFSECKVPAQWIISQNLLVTVEVVFPSLRDFLTWAKIVGCFFIIEKQEQSAVINNNHMNYLSNKQNI